MASELCLIQTRPAPTPAGRRSRGGVTGNASQHGKAPLALPGKRDSQTGSPGVEGLWVKLPVHDANLQPGPRFPSKPRIPPGTPPWPRRGARAGAIHEMSGVHRVEPVMLATRHLKTAEYFEDRARRSSHQGDRDRFLEFAQNHRDIAAGTRLETELPKRPPVPSEKQRAAGTRLNRVL
jgi:hypothetical protein